MHEPAEGPLFLQPQQEEDVLEKYFSQEKNPATEEYGRQAPDRGGKTPGRGDPPGLIADSAAKPGNQFIDQSYSEKGKRKIQGKPEEHKKVPINRLPDNILHCGTIGKLFIAPPGWWKGI
jgi:hypothetical protein